MKILMSGDWHGDPMAALHCIVEAQLQGCDAIFQLGDFGIWTHYEDGQEYLERIASAALGVGTPIYFIDGNHENFDDLEIMTKDDVGDFRFVRAFWQSGSPVLPMIQYVPRGTRWEWDGVRFLALGGAASVDKTPRLEWEKNGSPKSWWAQELITDEDEERAKQGGPVDVMLCHDAPFTDLSVMGLEGGYKVDAISRRSRERIASVAAAVQPRLLYHGHYHKRYCHEWNGTTMVEGLDCDMRLDKMVTVLDTRVISTNKR